VFDSMVVCVLLPRFALVVAAGGREALARGPAALAPEPGREQRIGEASASAEAFGVHAGMRLGEALARCPTLALIPPDPMGVADAWEKVVVRLESVGAAVETDGPGVAFFDASALARLHGGRRADDPAAALKARQRSAHPPPPPWLAGVVSAVRAGLRLPARIGAGPSRFCALAGAARARSRRTEIVDGARALAGEPVALLRRREEVAGLVEPLERLGIGTLGQLARLPRATVADRFGRTGELAHDLAHGRDTPLRPREPGETLEELLELPESASGAQLERALVLLVDKLLARRERRGRTLRSVVLGARLVEGGTWRERVVFREALADPVRMRLTLGQRLLLLPAPAEALQLSVERFGPPHAGARALFDDRNAQRGARLREAVRQARAVAGPEAALRVLEVDPDSRVPERRSVLAPFEP
jgi:protein ImuB